MKSIFYWLVLIISIAVIVSSCAKSDDSKTATTSSNITPTSCSEIKEPETITLGGSVECDMNDTTAPTVSLVCPAEGSSGVTVDTDISVTFSKEMNSNLIDSLNSSNACTGSIQVSSDNFSTCANIWMQAVYDLKTVFLKISDNLSFNTNYKVKVKTDAKDYCNSTPIESEYITTTGFTTTTDNSSITPTAPSGVTATLGWHQVAVDWTAVSGASSYTLYWGSSTGISSSSTAITGITDDNYTHTGLDNGTTYYYKVAAVNTAGTGSLSSEVSATPRTGRTVTEACTYGEAASGTVSGLKIASATGTYYHSMFGASPSNGCIDNSTAIAQYFSSVVASGTKGVRHAGIIQGNGNAFLDSWSFYMGDNCTKQSGFVSFYNDNLTVGDNITISTNQASGYPNEATKVFYKDSQRCILAETTSQEEKLETLFGLSFTLGTVHDQSNGTDNNTVLWTVLDNISGQTIDWFYTEQNGQNRTYPDNFTDQNGTTWHAGDNITR